MLRVAAFHRFAPLARPADHHAALRDGLRRDGVLGTVLIAPEGVNGTVAGPSAAVEAALRRLRALPGCAAMPARGSEAAAPPFGRLRVRLKREIVAMGRPGIPRAAPRVAPEAWNDVLRDPAVTVVDMRNHAEVAIGTFEGAEPAGTAAFGDVPGWWRRNRDRLRGRPVAMFCTGGIRCEKAAALLLDDGAAEVSQLDGGILAYLAAVAPERSLWRGGCFVFDGRVALGHGLRPSGHVLCHACRRPHPPEVRADPAWEEGVRCPACAGEYEAADRTRFRERMAQMRLAAARGAAHLGR